MKTTTSEGSKSQGFRTRRSCVAALLLAPFVLSPFACQSPDDAPRGQSGSEARGGSGPIAYDVASCPCNAAGVYLRATVLQQGGSQLLLRVEELIHGDAPLVAGQEVRASWNGELPCYVGQTSIEAGAEALVVLTPVERALTSCDASSECVDTDWTRGDVRLTPWADELLMAQSREATLTVRASELSSLWGDRAQCSAQYGNWSGLPGALDGVAP